MSREARAGNLTTDGKTIRSYSLVIGFNLGEQSYVIDYTGASGHFISQTTSTHVNAIKRECGVRIITYEEWEQMFKGLVYDIARGTFFGENQYRS